jgi:hypothetical protein
MKILQYFVEVQRKGMRNSSRNMDDGGLLLSIIMLTGMTKSPISSRNMEDGGLPLFSIMLTGMGLGASRHIFNHRPAIYEMG